MYLVTGATGTVGRPLVRALAATGKPVRAVSRQPATGLPDSVEVVPPEAVEVAMAGVESLFVHPRATKDHVRELLELAAARGVERVVVMSAINADDEPAHQPSRYNGDRNTEVERAAITSGLPWVSVRPSSFAMNTLAMWRDQLTRGDIVYGPYASFAEAVIHEQDVADVLARAMWDETLLGRRIPVTGPEAVTLRQMVAAIGEALGRPLRYQEIPADIAARRMIEHGLGEGFVHALLDRYARELERTPMVTGEVAVVLGRPPRPFTTWVTDHRAAWS
ncbi:NAD(P)H-binding protein [Nocardia abscessus]|uniref:NAD(P)H-binding protein n=1 Tax=Nocardia abscessus TaxID=120957 RepID=UPI001893DA84|nr:NAD(P)H-binding protein [Nocardia abscessus]MBF6338214.1 NAD(P)H-binding protein [Nocardia abscessus]